MYMVRCRSEALNTTTTDSPAVTVQRHFWSDEVRDPFGIRKGERYPVSLYRRHANSCALFAEGAKSDLMACLCPIWLYSKPKKHKVVRMSLQTSDYRVAISKEAEMSRDESPLSRFIDEVAVSKALLAVEVAEPDKEMVYLISTSQAVKIGVTSNLAARLKALLTASPNPMHIRCVIPRGGRDLEKRLQRIFAAHHRNREWFNLDSTLTSFIVRCNNFFRFPLPSEDCLDEIS